MLKRQILQSNSAVFTIFRPWCRQSVQGDSDSYRTYLPSEKPYRHIRRRSLSADSSNWPTEEDTRVLDHVPPHQQRLSGEMKHPHPVYPGKTAHNSLDNCDLRHENTHGMTGHRQDKYLDAKVFLLMTIFVSDR